MPSCLAPSPVIETHRGWCLLDSKTPFCAAKHKVFISHKYCVCQILETEVSLTWYGGLCLPLAQDQIAWVGFDIFSPHFYFTVICQVVWQSKLKHIKEERLLLYSELNCKLQQCISFVQKPFIQLYV